MSIDTDKIYESTTTAMCAFSPMSIGDLSLWEDNGKRLYKYTPKDDITTIELAHLMHLWLAAMSASRHLVQYDYWSFIKKHGLERHFEESKA